VRERLNEHGARCGRGERLNSRAVGGMLCIVVGMNCPQCPRRLLRCLHFHCGHAKPYADWLCGRPNELSAVSAVISVAKEDSPSSECSKVLPGALRCGAIRARENISVSHGVWFGVVRLNGVPTILKVLPSVRRHGAIRACGFASLQTL
jgi:hypothetical protein